MTQVEMLFASLVAAMGKLIFGYRFATVAATWANNQILRVWYEQRAMVSLKEGGIAPTSLIFQPISLHSPSLTRKFITHFLP